MPSVFERKNPIGLINAFRKAFQLHENVLLVIKTTHGNANLQKLQELKSAAFGLNVQIIDELCSDEEMINLIAVSDAYISLHRSEGLGLTMAQAMLLAKPVIATGYSGNLEFMNENNSLLVDYKKITLTQDFPPYPKNSQWADPSIEHAATLMRQLYDNQAYGRNLGQIAQQDLLKKFSYKYTGKLMKNRINKITELLYMRD